MMVATRGVVLALLVLRRVPARTAAPCTSIGGCRIAPGLRICPWARGRIRASESSLAILF